MALAGLLRDLLLAALPQDVARRAHLFFLPYLVMVPIGMALALFDDSGGAGIAYLRISSRSWGCRRCTPMPSTTSTARKRSGSSALRRAMSKANRRAVGQGRHQQCAADRFSIVLFLAVIGILAAIAIPAYQDYDAGAHGRRGSDRQSRRGSSLIAARIGRFPITSIRRVFPPWNNAYGDIRKVLEPLGFS